MKSFITILLCSLIFCLHANCQKVDEVIAKEALSIVNNRDTVKTALIDGRTTEMFAKKHIKGAINIDAFQDSLTNKLNFYLQKKEIIVYCTNNRRAEKIIEKFKEMQFQGKIIFIIDGINGWISAGFSTVSL